MYVLLFLSFFLELCSLFSYFCISLFMYLFRVVISLLFSFCIQYVLIESVLSPFIYLCIYGLFRDVFLSIGSCLLSLYFFLYLCSLFLCLFICFVIYFLLSVVRSFFTSL